MKRIQKCLIALASTLSLASCEGNFDLWDRGYGLIFNKEEHYRLIDGKKQNQGSHIFDKLVLAYEEKRNYDDDHSVHYYDYACRCGYRMSYSSFSFEKTEEGMALTGYKRAHTGYGVSNVTYQDRTLHGLYTIPSVYEGEVVTVLGENAFYNENAEYKGDENAFLNITTIKSHAFYKSNIDFALLNFPNVTTVEGGAFTESGSGKLVFGEKLTSLKGNAEDMPFENSGITGIDLSSCPVERLPIYSFNSCESLREISLPYSLKEIEAYAFYNCKALKKLVLPDGVAKIEKGAFLGCLNLESMVIPDSLASLSTDHFRFYGSEDPIPLRYIFYKGDEEQAKKAFESRFLSYVYYYSEEKPSEKGQYWHYVDTEPTIYE